ncbi:hypothetical protein OJAV_G00223760 [Oryzias javanicus]|uniref:Uncharacterized protein n=1 Tax=Oryzias javanicus TaxID=123683 RepID=A0A3S2PAU9_ORYJA|nr:hypothetical protein OJAV_G00223760 [Oryzias javanicus]
MDKIKSFYSTVQGGEKRRRRARKTVIVADGRNSLKREPCNVAGVEVRAVDRANIAPNLKKKTTIVNGASRCPWLWEISPNEQFAQRGVTAGIVTAATQWTADAERKKERVRASGRERGESRTPHRQLELACSKHALCTLHRLRILLLNLNVCRLLCSCTTCLREQKN